MDSGVDGGVTLMQQGSERSDTPFDIDDLICGNSSTKLWIASALDNQEKRIMEALAYHHRKASADVAKLVTELRALQSSLHATGTDCGPSRASASKQEVAASDDSSQRIDDDPKTPLELAQQRDKIEEKKAARANNMARVEKTLAPAPSQAEGSRRSLTNNQKLQVKSLEEDEPGDFTTGVKDCIMDMRQDWTNAFDLFMGIVVLVNAVILAIELQMFGMATSKWLRSGGDKPAEDEVLVLLDHVFICVYILELLIRLAVLRLKFFWQGHQVDWANMFDMTVVILSSIQAVSQRRTSVEVLRLIRPLKIVRVLRCIRVMVLFQPLRILATGLLASVGALCWSMVLLVIFMTLGGLILTSLLQDFILDESLDRDTRLWADEKYGTSVRSVWTMFQATLSGGWPNYAVPMVQEVNFWFIGFWLIYVIVVVFAVIRVISALFLKETLSAASSDAYVQMQNNMKQSEQFASRIRSVFHQADVSGDGYVSRDEFTAVLQTPLMQQYLKLLEVDIHEANDAFDLLDDGDNMVSYEEFLQGVVRMKGHARSLEVVAVLQHSKQLAILCAKIDSRCTGLDRRLQDLCKDLQLHPALGSRRLSQGD
eukprot:TRINITY_DN11136_c0_g1_i1.p1 TRINITY_DN11136_c0_g1~~TRINITY_DN11136_c0_g1_i1.p1  ORF type:complete len:597 (-),score=98.92 TRINITY_DN11136_c0_g1_i1:162-1952(-)